MKKIDVDEEVYRKLSEIAVPFKETTPNMVLRRLLGLPDSSTQTEDLHLSSIGYSKTKNDISPSDYSNIDNIEQHIEELRHASWGTHPAFLTFLMDKYNNTEGNYKTSHIMTFMEEINLRLSNGLYQNPWMRKPYGGQRHGLISCQRTIEHFRQTRKFGCWGGKDFKEGCEAYRECKYHPYSSSEIKNKCDLRNGVIWKRESKDSPFIYGSHYLKVIKKELLNERTIPLELFLKIVYPNSTYNEELIFQFKNNFNFSDEELSALFSI